MPPKKRAKKRSSVTSTAKKGAGVHVPEINIKTLKDFVMCHEEHRRQTFIDNNWPFLGSGATCTPQKMAAAGFYHCPTDNEPDLAKCFMCGKELDGWEPNDDPWEEHKSHASYCAFLKERKDPNTLTIRDFLKVQLSRQHSKVDRLIEAKIKEFDEYACQARHEILTMNE